MNGLALRKKVGVLLSSRLFGWQELNGAALFGGLVMNGYFVRLRRGETNGELLTEMELFLVDGVVGVGQSFLTGLDA